MTEPLFNMLFLCTHNSARSILAEALLNHWARGRVKAFSAGSHPRAEVNPLALQALRAREISVRGLHSKAWDLFATPKAPRLAVVITVCDSAAGEICPIWPGGPIKAHWGVEEPSLLAQGKSPDETLNAFISVLEKLQRRVRLFLDLPLENMDSAGLKMELDRIGKQH
ncbi:MAG: arsenate reductase ArsC [Magnetococcales bacterium]|nr:arsenate reductase ArsC [Magnetococcales bacterium]